MSASEAKIIVQEVAMIYPYIYCVYASCALLIYDWFLCLPQEIGFVWNWPSRVTSASVVYAFSRYSWLLGSILAVATNYQMSNRIIASVLGTIAFAAFSALRAYALSNKNRWLMAVIVILALLSVAMRVIQGFDHTYRDLPTPLNCVSSDSPPPTVLLSIREIEMILRVSQLAAELLVIGITWRYTYNWQLYHIQKGSVIKYRTSIISFLIYNGSIYFLFLATTYLVEIIICTASIPYAALNVGNLLENFYDPITSILTCRFILSLRQFDTTITSATLSELGSQVGQQHKASTTLQFAAQPGNSLPAFIASFAHPVHASSTMSETDSNITVDDTFELQEMDIVVEPSSESSF